MCSPHSLSFLNVLISAEGRGSVIFFGISFTLYTYKIRERGRYLMGIYGDDKPGKIFSRGYGNQSGMLTFHL